MCFKKLNYFTRWRLPTLSTLRLFFLILFVYIAPNTFAEDDGLNLKSLKGRSAEVDAQASIKAGRLRFLGIQGYALSVPGVDINNCLVIRNLVDVIGGTSDFISSKEESTLLKEAQEYAYKFNIIIKREFPNSPPMECIKPS